jgi:hypothetical protein
MKAHFSKVLMLCMLLTVSLYNCTEKNDDSMQPVDTEMFAKFDNLELEGVSIAVSPEVTYNPGNVELSSQTKTLNSDLEKIAASKTIPSSVSKAANETSALLTASEIKTLNNLTTANITNKNTAESAKIKAILAKVSADAKVQGYLPKLSLPTVTEAKSARIGTTDESTLRTAATSAKKNDNCTDKANEKYDKTKERLDKSKTKETGKALDAYTKDLDKIAKNLAKCVDQTSASRFEKMRQDGIKIANIALAALERAKPYISTSQYELTKALINIQLLDYLGKISQLEATKIATCTEIAATAKAVATSYRDSNLAAIENAYNTALSKAQKLRDEMISNCHNQGGGN